MSWNHVTRLKNVILGETSVRGDFVLKRVGTGGSLVVKNYLYDGGELGRWVVKVGLERLRKRGIIV